jgi:YggT family protein
MMGNPLEVIVITVGQVLSLMIIVDSLLSFALTPAHPIRQALGRVLQPMYAPIRRFLPSSGMFDFSPIVLLILIQVLVRLLTSIF